MFRSRAWLTQLCSSQSVLLREGRTAPGGVLKFCGEHFFYCRNWCWGAGMLDSILQRAGQSHFANIYMCPMWLDYTFL